MQKHKAQVAAVSGTRTKKSARKAAHAAKLAGKEQEALESAMQVGRLQQCVPSP